MCVSFCRTECTLLSQGYFFLTLSHFLGMLRCGFTGGPFVALHLWPFTSAFTVVNTAKPPISQFVEKSSLCFPESSVGRKRLWLPYWYSASLVHFYSPALAGLSGPFIPPPPFFWLICFAPSNAFAPLLPRHWDRKACNKLLVRASGGIGELCRTLPPLRSAPLCRVPLCVVCHCYLVR